MVIFLAALGLVIGSFAGATVWRLRARQLVQDNKDGESVDHKEYNRLLPLTKRSLKSDRSQCLSCARQLKWYDLIPVVSWMSTRGKCRYCKKSIGRFEPTIELSMSALFVLLFVYWQEGPIIGTGLSFVLWIIVIIMLVILFAYDLKWYLLPNVIVFSLIAVSSVIALLRIFSQSDIASAALGTVLALLILSGIYFALYVYSRARFGEDRTWVGFGDVKLGIALGLLVGSWPLAFLTLFLANLIGVIAILPSLLTKKISMKSHIPFGPLLIVGFFIAVFLGQAILAWYMGLSGIFAGSLATLML